MKACLPALGTKMAFSHPLDITNETNGLHHRLLHNTIADSTEASFTTFTYSQYISYASSNDQPFSLPVEQFLF